MNYERLLKETTTPRGRWAPACSFGDQIEFKDSVVGCQVALYFMENPQAELIDDPVLFRMSTDKRYWANITSLKGFITSYNRLENSFVESNRRADNPPTAEKDDASLRIAQNHFTNKTPFELKNMF